MYAILKFHIVRKEFCYFVHKRLINFWGGCVGLNKLCEPENFPVFLVREQEKQQEMSSELSTYCSFKKINIMSHVSP